jgi:hypothetical protein
VNADPGDHIEPVGQIVRDLRGLGLHPILVGGMALVILGSRRVTRDFDFLIDHPGDRLPGMVDAFYDRGFELISRLDESGNVTATIDTRKVAATRLRLDQPASAYFFEPSTRLRIDLLFDFPVPARTITERATRMKILGYVFEIASEDDLLRLKQIARSSRSVPGDADDIAFLESRLNRRPDRSTI